MSRAPQDVYARYLLSSRGYPLWIPEPSQQLLLSRPDGLRIGDVGVVVPEDGGFDVFFNICLPREHPSHRATGVPDNFKLVDLRDEDIRIIPRVENPGRIISTSSVTKIRTFEPSSATPGAQSGRSNYEFDLSSSGGALLILPEGADRYDLRNRRLFFEEATRHGVDWYRFAEERLGRMISPDSLYLITGFYKALSWSLAAFENAAGSGDFSAQFKMAQVGGSNITGSYTWETTRALDWRVGPAENYGFPNQSVFIRGFKVALRTDFLGHQRVEVKADAPSTNAKHGKFSDGVKRNSWMSKVWKGLSRNNRSGTSMQDEVVHGPATDEASGYYLSRGLPGDADKHVVVQPMPEFSEIFHPSDIINQYLFKKENSANVAVTHDDDWITLLDEGKLKPEDFVQMNSSRVEEIVANNFHVVSQEGVVFLQGKNDVAPDNNADQPPASPPIGTNEGEDVPDDSFNTPVDVEAPPPAYGTESPERREYTDVTEKPHLLPESLGVPALTLPQDIHWLLLPYDPRTSKHLLRFDIIFPVDQICYQYSNNARERLVNEDLDEPAFSEPITKMRITFEQRPFNWTIDVDNPHRIRCRDVFEAIYSSFNQQLTLGELWRLPDRCACEDAFRIRTLVLKSSQMERSLGWKRVDALLHHTIFHGLTMNPDSEGEWVLNLGAPLPVASHGLSLSPTSFFSRSRDSCSTEDSAESSDDHFSSSMSPILALRSLYTTEVVSAGRLALHSSPSVTTLAVPPRQRFVRSRPVHRPLGPRSHQSDVATDNNADQPPASPPIGTKGRENVPDDSFNTPVDVQAPPPAYGTESPERREYTDVTEKPYLLPESLGVPALTLPSDIHWLLLPYDPRTSKHLLRFDVIFPVDQICYQYSNNVRERLADEDLDEPAFSEPITKMRITFEQQPFNWTIDVDNSHRIRCRDVFEAIYSSFNQQLTLGELWRLPDRRACEDAFRIRTLVLKSSQMERSLGWKRVDALLHHTIFHGLTMNPDSEGEWVLNLGAPLPVASRGLPLSPTSIFSRRDSDSSSTDSAESSDDHFNSSMSPILALRSL